MASDTILQILKLTLFGIMVPASPRILNQTLTWRLVSVDVTETVEPRLRSASFKMTVTSAQGSAINTKLKSEKFRNF